MCDGKFCIFYDLILLKYLYLFVQSGMTTCKMRILVAELMDHESMPDMIFIIEVTDKDGMKIVELFKLTIQDQNEAPTVSCCNILKCGISNGSTGKTRADL